jgi:hypothetical protein
MAGFSLSMVPTQGSPRFVPCSTRLDCWHPCCCWCGGACAAPSHQLLALISRCQSTRLCSLLGDRAARIVVEGLHESAASAA